MKDKTGIYNISGPDMHSIYDMAKLVAAHWKLDANLISPVKSATLNQPAKRPPKTGFIILKAQSELGYKPHSFKDGLAFLDKQMQDYGI
jgi:dTDP-4-dehydrorhamnose reductase